MSENQVEFLASPVKGGIQTLSSIRQKQTVDIQCGVLFDRHEIKNKSDRQIYLKQE